MSSSGCINNYIKLGNFVIRYLLHLKMIVKGIGKLCVSTSISSLLQITKDVEYTLGFLDGFAIMTNCDIIFLEKLTIEEREFFKMKDDVNELDFSLFVEDYGGDDFLEDSCDKISWKIIDNTNNVYSSK